MLEPGSQLLRGYAIDRILGQGGMGTVYLARQTTLGDRRVALKEVHLEASTPEMQARLVDLLKREATIIASLEHPALVRVIEFFEEAGTHYFAMEFIDGKSLQDCLEHGKIEVSLALTWMDQILDTLSWLHERQPPVIVRDLKPSNLMLDANGRVRIIDFGIAGIQDGSKTQTVLKGAGTMGYAPAEQFGMRGTVDARADIYAAGATLYSLVTGEVPPFALDLATGDAEITPPTSLNPQVSQELEAIIFKMMALKRDHRYSTAREAREILSQATLGAAGLEAAAAVAQVIPPTVAPTVEVAAVPVPVPEPVPVIPMMPAVAAPVATPDPAASPVSPEGGTVVLKSRDIHLTPYAQELAPLGFILEGNELFGDRFWCQTTRLGSANRSLHTFDYKVEIPGCPPELQVRVRGPLTLKLSPAERASAIATGDSDFDALCLVHCSDQQLALDYLTSGRRRFLLTCLPGVPLEINGGMVSGHWTMNTTLDKYLQPLVRLRSLHNPPEVELAPAGWIEREKTVGATRPLGSWAMMLGVALFFLMPFRLPETELRTLLIGNWIIGAAVCLTTFILAVRVARGGPASLVRTVLWLNRLFLLVLLGTIVFGIPPSVPFATRLLAGVMLLAIPGLIYGVCDKIACEAID